MERSLLTHLLSLQCTIFQIPFYLYDSEERLEAFEPYPISCDIVIPWLKFLLESDDNPNYYLTNELLILGRIKDTSSGLQIIIGPVRVCHLTENMLHNIVLSARLHIQADQMQEVGEFLSSCNSYILDQFMPILCSLHGFINQKVILPNTLLVNDSIFKPTEALQTNMVTTTVKHSYEENQRRNHSEFEARMLYYVSNGMTDKLKKLHFTHKDIGNLASNSLRHFKNATIILNTLCQRAAIYGGLDPEISYQLGEIYIQQIEACQDMDSLTKINSQFTLAADYCERVAQVISPQTKHPVINDVMHYIRENHQKRLTVSEIADHVKLAPEYLSTKFKQVTGMTIPDYINQQKITEAKELLLFTDMSLSEIAQYLSFSSQSYFQTIFKKITGKTPMEFRSKNKMF